MIVVDLDKAEIVDEDKLEVVEECSGEGTRIYRMREGDGLYFELSDGDHSAVVISSSKYGGILPLRDKVKVPDVLRIEGELYVVDWIDEGAFAGYDGVTEVVLPEALLGIGDEAFVDCKGLRNIVLPPNLYHIGRDAFRGCNMKIYCKSKWFRREEDMLVSNSSSCWVGDLEIC